MAALPSEQVRLLVVGEDAPNYFQELAGDLKLSSRCTWEKSRDDVIDCYAAADVYISPSREDSFGLPVAEAMACGLPVITSSFAGISSLLHDGKDSFVLRDPDDIESLGKFIRLLSEQKELRERMGATASRAAQEWTWDRNAAAVWEMIKDSIKAGRS